MYYTAKDLIQVLNISKAKYVSLIHAGNLICTHPSFARGVSHKYSKEDLIRNFVIVELINCGLVHKEAFNLASGWHSTSNGMFFAQLGTVSTISVPLLDFKEKLENFK